MHHVLFYDTAPDYLERRATYRKNHLALATEAHARGDLVLAGAFANPVDGAMLVFRSRDAAEAFAKNDPYVQNGLVREWRVRDWATVIGDGITPPAV